MNMNSTLSIKPLSNESLKTNSTNWQMEVLMEKLRSKACSLRSMPETAKLIKQSILNKQHILDPGEKAALGQCLDQLQQNIKVTSLPAMVERLESTARQLGLTFTSRSSAPEVYISCDMFYVEVHLQNEGKVKDVTVELAGDQNEPRSQSSPELVECLNQGNFADFMGHLEGFLSIYQLNTDKKTKCKAYQALQALEVDLLKLFEMSQETFGNDSQRLILKSPVGLLIKRKGGHPVRMIYFNSPYELLDVDQQRSISLTHETAATRDLEYHVSVTIEASTSRKLQAASLVNIMKGNDGLTLPSISGLSSANSVPLPACFTLRLKKPMAISLALANKISDVTGIPCYDISSKQSLLPLIIKQEAISNLQMDTNNNKGLFVTLPDQQHCYFVANNDDFEGVLVHRVPFSHPTSVAPILDFLRVQAVFNSLITSCVRPESKQSMESAFIFEVTAVSHDYISVTFEHPQEESTATAELDLTDITNVKCKLYTLTNDPVLCSDEYATKVFQRCLSIPITMRAVMRKIVKEEKKVILPQGDSVVKMDSNNVQADPNQNTKFLFNDYGSLGIRRDQVMGPHSNNINNVLAKDSTCNQALFGGNTNDSNQTLISAIGGSTNSVTSTLVGSFGSSLLPSICQQKNQVQHHFLADGKMAKVRKRKSGLDTDHKSPKTSDDIVIEVNDKTADSLINEASLHMRRDIKFEKLPNILGKRRSSADGTGLSDTGSSELAALREKVYGAGSAASFAKLSYMHSGSKDTKDFSKKFKKQKSEGGGGEFKKSPIVLDLTDAESARKMGAVTGTTATSSSVSLSAALLKRPGIEIIPIPGSNTPISIPSSITVTPVIKSSDDKFKDKKDKKDRKDLDKKDKKRRREDSPNRGSGGSSLLAKSSKIQIINTGMKHSTLSSLESLKGDGKSLSGVTMKPSTPYHSPIKKPSLSPNISKTIIPPNKVTYSPTHKPNKLHYNPTHLSVSSSVTTTSSTSMLTTSSNSSSTSSSSKGITSPKPSSSPKHSSVSPKHSSIGKPSMNTLKSNSPTFTKPSLSPKLNKSIKDKEKSSSPSRPLSSPIPFSSNSATSPLSMKTKYSSATEKPKPVFSEALTITKVSSGETISSSSISLTSCSLSSAFSQTGTQNISAASLLEKLSVEKAKASPPKNRKGSSLSDIVDKLRAGVSGSSGDPQCKDKNPKVGPDGKKEGDNFTIKSSTGLKFTINKAKHKEGGSAKSNSAGYPSPNSTMTSSKNSSKSSSGLKPGVMSAPASKKVSMSSLPPIPKLPPASISNITATAISPLGNSLSMAHSSPLQYVRERQRDSKERDRDKDRVSNIDKLKSKDTLSTFKGNISAENKKDSQDKNFIGKSNVQKEDKRSHQSGLSPKKKPVITDSVDRALKEFFGEDDNPAQDCPENAIESLNSSEYLKQNASRKSLVGDRLEHKPKCDISKEVDSIKDDSELMAPPLIPLTPLIKPLEKDALHCVPSSESLQKDNTPALSSYQLPRPDSPIIFPPASPSVSIKIVKSPAPVTSPLNMISPQSVSSQHSPCIIDDELMDEALMGSRK